MCECARGCARSGQSALGDVRFYMRCAIEPSPRRVRARLANSSSSMSSRSARVIFASGAPREARSSLTVLSAEVPNMAAMMTTGEIVPGC